MNSESDTRAKLIDPALHQSGWSEDSIRREETAGAIDIVAGQPKKRAGRADYILRVKISDDTRPIRIAVIEAKAENLPPNHGLQQAKDYGSHKRLNVPFVFSSNGHQFVEFDAFSGLTSNAKPMSEFPSPEALRARYEAGKGISLSSEIARPLITRHTGSDASLRYYQEAAVQAVFEKIASGGNRALLTLATGTGKTRIAVALLKRIQLAGQLNRALFICDRTELRTQALSALSHEFANDAAAANAGNPEKNARVIVATYQTLGVDKEDGDASFLTTHYDENYFSHIIIDECHRSAWGKWSEVLTRNPNAIQIGLTATPREFEYTEQSAAAVADQQITADNLKYFGDPVYEYTIGQAIEDGYLAAMEIIKNNVFINQKDFPEEFTGVEHEDLAGLDIKDPITGEDADIASVKEHYSANSFENTLMLPDRVEKMSRDLFNYLSASGNPHQKTIIFCARDKHADDVAIMMNNLYSQWCSENGSTPLQDYAFKCTAAEGKDDLPDFRGASRHHLIATTVDLLTTGVDVPVVENIVFFKYVNSPISFYQMVGRGTRLNPPTEKLMFKVYDYTNATRLFGQTLKERFSLKSEQDQDKEAIHIDEKSKTIQVEGLDVTINLAGTFILSMNEAGVAVPVTLEEYKQKLASSLLEEIPSVDEFREAWIVPQKREVIIGHMPDGGRAPIVIKELNEMSEYDLYDVIAELAYGNAPKTMVQRADSFNYKHQVWLDSIPETASRVIRAVASQFGKGGIDNLENPSIFQTPEVKNAGGVTGLQEYPEGLREDRPRTALEETKRRIYSA